MRIKLKSRKMKGTPIEKRLKAIDELLKLTTLTLTIFNN